MKYCPKCDKEKLESEFYVDKIKKDGLTGFCKICCKQRTKKYNKDYPEKKREADRKYYKAHPEKAKTQSARWKRDNPDRAKEGNKKYRENNLKKCRNAVSK